MKKNKDIPAFFSVLVTLLFGIAVQTDAVVSGFCPESGSSTEYVQSYDIIRECCPSFARQTEHIIYPGESQVSVPRNTTVSNTPRQYSFGKRTGQSYSGIFMLKDGKLICRNTLTVYKSSISLFSTGCLWNGNGKFLYLKRLII